MSDTGEDPPQVTSMDEEIGILVVANDAPVVEQLLCSLRQAHILNRITVVRTIATAEDCLHRRGAFAGTDPLGLVFVGLHLPDGSGLELRARLQESPDPVRVVLLAASDEEQRYLAGQQLEEWSHLVWPFQPLALLALIAQSDQLGFEIHRYPAAVSALRAP